MPSMQLIAGVSGLGLVSGNCYSGTPNPIGGIYLRLTSGECLVSTPDPNSILPSLPVTLNSGGVLSSGGLGDGMILYAGGAGSLFITKARLPSGVQSIQLAVPTASSGNRLYWDWGVGPGY